MEQHIFQRLLVWFAFVLFLVSYLTENICCHWISADSYYIIWDIISVTILSHDLAYVVCHADTTTFMRTLDLIFSVHHSLYLQLQWDTHFINSCWILNECEKKLITCSGSQAINSRCVGILCSLYHITSKWGFSHSLPPLSV